MTTIIHMKLHSRVDQVKFFKDFFPQILLGPFFNTLSHMKLKVLWPVLSENLVHFLTPSISFLRRSSLTKLYVELVSKLVSKSEFFLIN